MCVCIVEISYHMVKCWEYVDIPCVVMHVLQQCSVALYSVTGM